jgi:hypothetical protein
MGNVIVFGAEVNWYRWHHRGERASRRRLWQRLAKAS